MKKVPTFTAYKKAESNGFKSRAVYALKMKSLKAFLSLANDFAAVHFARYLVLDCHGTKRFCWTIEAAHAWLPYCSEKARIVDTLDFTVVAERVQKYACTTVAHSYK